MQLLLTEYMEKRMQEKGIIPVIARKGPVVTISREAGCSANQIAQLLVGKINRKLASSTTLRWRMVNKEIVIEAARELDLPPERIDYVFKAEDRKLVDDMIAALSSRYYKSDAIIRKTIMKAIRAIIDDGFVVMVGRGGVAFTRKHPAALNIMLHAPMDWRIGRVMDKLGLGQEAAARHVRETDHERRLLVDHFCEHPVDHTIYDMLYNVERFSSEEVAESIFQMLLIKKLV